MKNLLSSSFIFFLFLIVSLLSTCSRDDDNTFRIAFNTWIGYGPFYVAQEKGFFSDENLNVELIRMEGTGERRAALIADRIEALGSTIDDFVIGLSQGLNGVMVLAIDESYGADGIVAKEGIYSIRDFKNKRVAVQPGFVNHFFLLYLLETESLTQNDIIILPMEPDKAANALLAGDVDVAVTWEPHLSVIKNRPGYNLVVTTADEVAQHVIVDNLVIREDVINKRRKAVERLLRAWFRAIEYIRNNPSESAKIMAKAFELQTDEITDMLSGVKFISFEDNLSFFDRAQSFNFYSLANKALSLYTNAGIIENPSRAQPLMDKINGEFLTQLKKQ